MGVNLDLWNSQVELLKLIVLDCLLQWFILLLTVIGFVSVFVFVFILVLILFVLLVPAPLVDLGFTESSFAGNSLVSFFAPSWILFEFFHQVSHGVWIFAIAFVSFKMLLHLLLHVEGRILWGDVITVKMGLVGNHTRMEGWTINWEHLRRVREAGVCTLNVMVVSMWANHRWMWRTHEWLTIIMIRLTLWEWTVREMLRRGKIGRWWWHHILIVEPRHVIFGRTSL